LQKVVLGLGMRITRRWVAGVAALLKTNPKREEKRGVKRGKKCIGVTMGQVATPATPEEGFPT
jgi:hypothetical protein